MVRARKLVETTWSAIPPEPIVLVPVGSTEQHGPHLPFDVDTRIAAAVCDAVGAAWAGRRAIVVAPPMPFGSSGEHQAFPGTSSIGTPVLSAVLVELGRSLSGWAHHVHFVNGHGGNVDALEAAVLLLGDEGRSAAWSACRHGDAHAGRRETSLMMHLAPEQVGAAAIEPGNTGALHDLLPALRRHGVRAVSPNGVLGDPRGATAAEGERLLAEMAAAISTEVGRLDAREPDDALR